MPELNLVLLGPPGSGKGTQGERLNADLRLPYYATGDILRGAVRDETELGKSAKAYMDAGDLVPDEVIVGVIAERIDSEEAVDGFILDGYPRSVEQARALDEMLKNHNTKLDAVLEFAVSEAELFERLKSRGRADDTEEVIHNRMQVYRDETEPLLEYYSHNNLQTVDAVGTLDEVFARALRALGR